jgi:hypothetical protein
MRIDGIAHDLRFPILRQIDMCNLPGSVNAGVGSSRAVDANALA